MQSLAQMLAMVADSASADWHLWLRHVAFAYNSSEHATTGASPFLLATGREPRIALHSLIGEQRSDKIAAATGGVHELVADMMQRQRSAEAVMDRRRALQQQHVLSKNAALAAAFGVRQHFVAGGLSVGVSTCTLTHSGSSYGGAQLSWRACAVQQEAAGRLAGAL